MITMQDTEQVVENLTELLKIAKENYSEERYTKVEKMYETLQDRIIVAPASGVAHYHSAYAGGYLVHVLNVIKASLKITAVLKAMDGDIDFTKEELVFAAMHHDLGKLGDLSHPYYIPNTSEWHIKNKGEYFAHDTDIQYMSVPDRSLFLLQHFGIQITQKEFIAIKLHDGMYGEGNKSYLMNNGKLPMKTNLPYVLHWADHISTVAERDQWKLKEFGEVKTD